MSTSDVLRYTAPEGLDAEAWRKVLLEAKESHLVWPADPWVDGSAGCLDFCDGPGRDAVADGSGAPTGRAVSRAEFRQQVARHPWERKGGRVQLSEVLLAMASYADEEGRNAYPSNATLAKELGLKRETVNRKVADAVDGGWLRRVGKVGRTVCYELTCPVDV